MLIDRHHETIFHREPGRGEDEHAAQIWLRLMEREGFEISYLDAPIDTKALESADLFILAGLPVETGLLHTAQDGEQTVLTRSPLQRSEIEALGRWIGKGGALMIFASHYPNGGGTRPLLDALGVRFRDGFVHHPEHPSLGGGQCSWFTMTEGNGLLRQQHPILATPAEGLPVAAVRWLCGAALMRYPQDVVLDLPDATVNFSPRPGTSMAREVSDDYAAALAFPYGAGKVFVSGDQGIFRNFVYRFGQESVHVTITDPEAENGHFLVRVMRWLGQR
ncbi:MAG: hypothetical protein AAGD01_10065 [Acidobacteriota bacterium]